MFLSGKIVKSAKKDILACVMLLLGCAAHLVIWLAAGKGEIKGFMPMLFGLAGIYLAKVIFAVIAKKYAYENTKINTVKMCAVIFVIASLAAFGCAAMMFIMALGTMFDEYSTLEIFITFASVVALIGFSLLDLVEMFSIRKDSAEVVKSGSLDPWKEINKDKNEVI